jgi:hypothetical protein
VSYLEHHAGEPSSQAPIPGLSKWVRMDLPRYIDFVEEEDEHAE